MRDIKIDVLRFIAVIGILVAHVQPPDFWFQLRNFDVPLMALLMGASFYLSKKDKKIQYGNYVIKRLKRLVGPTWQFLTLYFGAITLVYLFIGKDLPFDWKTIVLSYLLLDGIGYVWIIGVFVIVALLNPIILSYSLNIKDNSKYFLTLGILYAAYLLLTVLNGFLNESAAFLFERLILYTMGYGLIAAVGIRIKQLSKKEMWIGFVGFTSIYLILAIVNDFAVTNVAKYPPTTYYFSYALAVVFGLFLLFDNEKIVHFFDNRLVIYISKNSMWFYLWHILVITFVSIAGEFVPILATSWALRFIFVFLVTLMITIGHEILLSKFNTLKHKYDK